MWIKILNALPENAIDIYNINSLTWLQTYKSEKYWINENLVNKYTTSEEKKSAFINKKSKEIQDNLWSYIVLIDDNKVVWYAWWKRHSNKNYNEFFAIYILHEYHKRWLWKELANKVFSYLWFEKDIIVKVIWYNENAIEFYKNLWFEKDKDLEDFEIFDWIWVPEIQMRKKTII